MICQCRQVARDSPCALVRLPFEPEKASDGSAESRANGYLFPYGDYEGIDIAPGNDRAAMVWGEGWNYDGGPDQRNTVIFRTPPL